MILITHTSIVTWSFTLGYPREVHTSQSLILDWNYLRLDLYAQSIVNLTNRKGKVYMKLGLVNASSLFVEFVTLQHQQYIKR